MLKSVLNRCYLACMAIAAFAMPALVHAQVVLPDTGVDVDGHVTALVTALGAIVATCVGAWFAFTAIKKGLSWVRKV